MNGINGPSTVLSELNEHSLSTSRQLRSIASSTSNKRIYSLISKTYEQASTLFLTRRLSESLQTLDPLLSQSQATDGLQNDEEATAPSLVSRAKRSTRVKIWNLYLSLLNAIIELGPEDGKNAFGGKEWRILQAKAQDGTIWEEVTNVGYGGVEGNVDADVVSSLATLLLAHSLSQTVTQTHLETYLSAARYPLSDRFETSSQTSTNDHQQQLQTNGTDAPRDLNVRIKILELYALHVLPRNEEWEYAKEFISMNEFLDEERREVFLQTLQGLEEQRHTVLDQEAVIVWREEEKLEPESKEIEEFETDEANPDKKRINKAPDTRQHKRSDSEMDYGIDEPTMVKELKRHPGPSNLRAIRQPQVNGRLSPTSRGLRKTGQQSTYGRGVALMTALQRMVLKMAQSMSRNPMILLRMILFLVALIVAFGRRDIRDRLNRITGQGWKKIKSTVGMGMKVSYL